jgi:hypothetical protein
MCFGPGDKSPGYCHMSLRDEESSQEALILVPLASIFHGCSPPSCDICSFTDFPSGLACRQGQWQEWANINSEIRRSILQILNSCNS